MKQEALFQNAAAFKRWAVHEADLYGADMRGIKTLHVDMRGAKLGSAKLCRADLTEAIIDCADLNSAKLEKARLCRATAHIVKMQGCCLKDADLRGTVEYRADPEQKDKEAEVEDIAEGLGKLLRELLRLCGLQDPS